MEDKSKLFSQAALDKLRSPEKLDMLLPITTPLGWMGLLAMGLLLLSVLIWSVFGSFTVRAEGMGLIMDSGGVAVITPTAGGRVDYFNVREGAQIRAGDVIARLSQPEQSADVLMAQFGTQLGDNLKDTAQRAYQHQNKIYHEFMAKDVISRYSGILDKLLVRDGAQVSSGTPIATVRLTRNRDELTGALYVPADKGKRIQPGQTLQLVPGGVDVQESGSLMGVVLEVSDYPVPQQYMEAVLGNPLLVQQIAQQEGAVVEVVFSLVKDEDDPSGYLWTSVVGEHRPVTAGSFVTGSVIIDRHPPIEKVFYKISQWLRNR